MLPAREPKKRGQQVLEPSPGCALNCQALSIHLPPLLNSQDRAGQSAQSSLSMSASSKQSKYDATLYRHVNYNSQYPESSVSAQSAYARSEYAQPQESHSFRYRSPGFQPETSITRNSADVSISQNSMRYGSDMQPGREESNDELSSLTHGSPDSQQLAAGPPGIARRAKAHVPSACVNCKRKHLACETRRPCNRCVQTGKETSCIDVQHKKRGRPRLREGDASRELNYTQDYNSNRELYPNQSGVLVASQSSRQRTKSYRELRSQPDHQLEQRVKTSEHGYSIHQPTIGLPYSPPTVYLSETIPTALLSPDFFVIQHNHAFADALALSRSPKGCPLTDLVIPAEREKIQRLHLALQAELHDTSMMHNSYKGSNDMPAIENLDLGNATAGFQPRTEYWTFHLPKGQSRGFPITISLARGGAHFVILTLVRSTSTIMLPSPHGHDGVRNQSLPSPTSAQKPRLSNGDYHAAHHHHPSQNSHSEGSASYTSQASPQKSLTAGGRTLLMQPSPDVSLDHYRQLSPPRTAGLSAHIGGNPPSPRLSRSSQSQHQPTSSEHLQHLKLPPIKTTGSGRGEPARLHDGKGGKQSPAKGSPQSGRRKKRQRVDIGDVVD